MTNPLAFTTDFDLLVSALSADIAPRRARNGYPPLQPYGNVELGGRERPTYQESPPRILIVPTTIQIVPAMRAGRQVAGPLAAPSANDNPGKYWDALCWLRVGLWGDNGPTAPNSTSVAAPGYAFSSTFELLRELGGALYRVLGGAPSIAWGDIQWEQSTGDQTLGRAMAVSVAFRAAITQDMYIALPFSRIKGDGGVTVNVEVVASDPASSATDVESFAVPST